MHTIHLPYDEITDDEITDGASDAPFPTQREGAVETVRVALCTDRAAWDAYVARAGGSLLQSWPWGAFKRQQGWRTLRLVALRDGDPCAALQVLTRRVPGVGAFLYAAEGPVLPAADWANGAASLGPLLAAARRYGQGIGALALRVDPLTPAAPATEALAAHGLRRGPANVQPAVTAVLDLSPSEDALLAGCDRGARRLLRYARRDGVTVRPGAPADIAPFARWIAETGRRKGFGVRDEAYVRGLDATFRAYNSGDFFVAERAGAPIAAMLAAPFGARYFALYCASSAEGRRVSAQYLIQWTALMHAKRLGCRLYDFRGMAATDDPADPWAGLSFFKTRLGARREESPGAWDDVYRPLAYNGMVWAQRTRRAWRARAHRATGDTQTAGGAHAR